MITSPHGVPTAASLHRHHCRLDRKLATATTALAAMRRGQSLHLQYRAGRAFWSLSGGQSVSADVATILTSNASVAPVDDALFSNMPGQTWRHIHG